MIASQPAAGGDPAEAAFNDPPPELHREALLAFLGFDDLDRDGRGCANRLASIGVVGKALGQEGEQPMRCAKQVNCR